MSSYFGAATRMGGTIRAGFACSRSQKAAGMAAGLCGRGKVSLPRLRITTWLLVAAFDLGNPSCVAADAN
jgi:hypothetical protein